MSHFFVMWLELRRFDAQVFFIRDGIQFPDLVHSLR